MLYALKTDGQSFRPVWASENIVNLLGYTPVEASASDWWISHLHPDDRDEAINRRSGISFVNQVTSEYRFLHRDGKYRWVRDEQRVIKSADGEPIEVMGN